MSVSVSRLKRRDEFLRVAAGRRKWAAPGLVLQVLRREGDTEDVRVGFTVSKKVGGAVERNRVKRRLRAAVDRVVPTHARLGMDYVVIGRRQALSRKFPDLVADLEAAMRRLKAFAPTAGQEQ